MGTGILLLNLPDPNAGERPVAGLEEFDIGDMSGLSILRLVLSNSAVRGDSGGETSSGYREEDLGGRAFCGVELSFISGEGCE